MQGYGTGLFEWARGQGMDPETTEGMARLAVVTGYTARHLYRIYGGHYGVSERFAARVIYRLGDWARSLFSAPTASEEADKESALSAGMTYKATGEAQDERGAGCGYPATCKRAGSEMERVA